jgi:hypothetical protein
MYNLVFKHVEYLPLESEYETIKENISNLISTDLYAYFVGRKDDVLVIKIYISSTDEYNTIRKENAKERIITSIIDYLVSLSNAKCIDFQQPPLELIIELYQPMLKKMADKLHQQWRQFEYEDLVSMANLVVVKLHNQGYYLNKSIIWTALNNDILVECRKLKSQPVLVSFEDVIKSTFKIDSEELAYGDMIKDESIEEEKERDDERQLEKYVFEQVKDIIIDKIGERRWDRLWRDYSKGHAAIGTRQEMKRLKSLFKTLGLTRQDFINYYRR